MARALALTFTALLALAAPAVAAPERSTLRTADTQSRLCHAQPLTDRAGVATERWRAPATGFVRVALEGTRFSDWDLAVFGPANARLGASTSFGAAEQATVQVRAGEQLLVQACRRSGREASVPLSIELFPGSISGAGETARLVEVPLQGASDMARLEATGLDVTHAHDTDSAKVVLYTASDATKLRREGFDFTVEIADLAAFDAADRRRELLAPSARALPSARTTYRQLQDYTTDLKNLADQNPGLVRKVTLPLPSFENRPIEGVEIAAGVNRTDDGRPVYLQMGAHHAREWPSAEFPMEFALDLVARYNANDARARALLDDVRVVVVPVVNPDGFAVSRGAGEPTVIDDDGNATLPQALNDFAAYKRKNCRPTVPGADALPCAMRSNSGVDLNRNYGAYWGGPGSSSDTTTQGYRGTAPYSEPESEAVHRFTARRHVVTFITNHTFTDDGKFLRQPGFDAPFLTQTDGNGNRITPDEAGMKALGDAMGAATGWTSELGYETLGDITGATEDWNYFSQGTYGYTPEARGPNFHANYADHVIAEYEGAGTVADGSVYEAFLRAGEQAANPAGHSIVRGAAAPGRVLRLKKSFTTATSMDGLVVNDTLNTTMTVPADGTYEWHVNPSKRPLFANSAEVWTMTCEDSAGNVLDTAQVSVARGQAVTQNLACGTVPGGTDPSVPGAPGAGTPPVVDTNPNSAKLVCSAPTGRTSGKGLDRARLGRKRATNRGRFLKGGRKRASVDTFCFTDARNVRIGYPSSRLLRRMSAANRRRTRGRAVLLLTSSTRFSLARTKAGDSLASLRGRRKLSRGYRVGANTWYLATGNGTRLVFKVRGGVVREVGLADLRLTRGRAAARRFLNSFR